MIPVMWVRRLIKRSMDNLNRLPSTGTLIQEELFPSFPANGCPGVHVRANLIPVPYTQMEPILVVLLRRLMYLKHRYDLSDMRPGHAYHTLW